MFDKNYIITGVIRCETGLHIGDSSDTVEIGGSDSPIVRDVISGLPYIPGSSLKGKIRSLFELSDPHSSESIIENAKSGKDVNVSTCLDCDAVKLFGTTPDETKNSDDKTVNFQTRLLVRDCHPTEGTEKLWKQNDDLLNGAELKWENTINRVTAKATPRNLERVPKGSEFKFEMIISKYDSDDEFNYLKRLLDSIYLLENDYLGGSGSRGSGQVSFNNISIVKRDLAFYRDDADEEIIIKNKSLTDARNEIKKMG